ncbi:MAG TPA: DUF6265 family protein [Burkholderiaceae bacterium]|nr:DUF6265 family protein [Burkholderiaceae bacterium]
MMETRAVVLFVLMLGSSLAQAQGAGGVQRLAWLQGCWRLDAGARIVEEQWMAPRGQTMLGSSRTVRDGKTIEHEFVIVRETAGGQLAYEVSPSGRPPTVFTSTSVADDGSVVFENLQHDFPQRVAYRRNGADLLAWIEGPAKNAPGQLRRIEFPYRRAACTDQP